MEIRKHPCGCPRYRYTHNSYKSCLLKRPYTNALHIVHAPASRRCKTDARIPEHQGTCLSRHAMPAISFTGCTSPASIGLNATVPATPYTLTRCGASSHALTLRNSHTKGVVFACVTLPHHTDMHEYTHIFVCTRLSPELFLPRFVCVSRSLNIRV